MTITKTKMIKFKLSILFLILCTSIYGQKLIGDEYPGYIVTSQNDSINGTIRFVTNISNKNHCDFKKNDSNKYQLYKPEELSSFGIHDGRRFHSRIVELDTTTNQYFLELLVDGIVDLYILKDRDKLNYFIEKGDKIFELSNNEFKAKDEFDVTTVRSTEQYKSMLIQLFQDSEISKKTINNSPFSQVALVNLTKEYHENVCDTYDCIDYTRINKARITLEIFAALPRANITLSGFNQTAIENNYSFGTLLTIKPKNLFKTVEFITGVSYSKAQSNFDFDPIETTAGLIKNELFDIKINYLTIPLGLRYYLNYTNKLRFYTTLQFNLNFLFRSSFYNEAYWTVNHDPNYRGYLYEFDYIYNRLFNGFSGEVGCNYQFSEVSSLSFSVYHDRNLPIFAKNVNLLVLNQTGIRLSLKQKLN